MTPRLLTWEEKGTGNPSTMMGGAGVCCDLVRVDLEPMSRASVLLPFSFKKSAHPAPDVIKAGDEGGGRDGSGGFGGDVDLCVISVTVKMDPMVTEDCVLGPQGPGRPAACCCWRRSR